MHRWPGSPVAERSPLDPSIIPQREIEQTPEEEGVVCPTGSLLIKQVLDVRVIEELAAAKGRFHDRVFYHGPEPVQHPFAYGHAEPLLFSLKHSIRDLAL